jgi:Na+/melibiose symporter-like transporter
MKNGQSRDIDNNSVLCLMLSMSLDCPFFISRPRSVSCVYCCLCLWIVHSSFPVLVLCLVSDVVYVDTERRREMKNGQSRDIDNIRHKTQNEDGK